MRHIKQFSVQDPFLRQDTKKSFNRLNWTINCKACQLLPWALLLPDMRSNLLLTPSRTQTPWRPSDHFTVLCAHWRIEHISLTVAFCSWGEFFPEIASLGRQASPLQVYKSNVICTLGLWENYYFLLFQLMSAVAVNGKRENRKETESINISEPFWFSLNLCFY